MPTISGSVESKSRDGKSIKVQGNWYSCFLPVIIANANVGDAITFEYTEKPSADGSRVYKNIKGVPQINSNGGGGAATPAHAHSNGGPSVSNNRIEAKQGDVKVHTQRSIVRSHAITAAISIVSANKTEAGFTWEDILNMAKKVESFTSGDMDFGGSEEA